LAPTGLHLSELSNKLTRDQQQKEDESGTKPFKVVLFAQGSVNLKELGILVILTTLPCNSFAFELKNKKNHLIIN